MPINQTELLNVAQTIAEEENLQVTVKESLKGGCIAAGGAIMGGLLAGPVGLAIGIVFSFFFCRFNYFF